MTERLAGEGYHINRSEELGLPYGTGKHYGEADIERFVAAFEPQIIVNFNPDIVRPLARDMIGGYYVTTAKMAVEAGLDVNEPDTKLGLMATTLHTLANIAFNPNPRIDTNVFELLDAKTPIERLDAMISLLGEYMAERSVKPLHRDKKPEDIQIQTRERQIVAMSQQHAMLFKDIADLYGFYDPVNVNRINQNLAASQVPTLDK
jgi:hypothetical protein